MYANSHRQALLGTDAHCMTLLFSIKITLFVGTKCLETCVFGEWVLFFWGGSGAGNQFSK